MAERPLSQHAREVLKSLCSGKRARMTVNPGVSGKLIRMGLAFEEIAVDGAGRELPHLFITALGRAVADGEGDRG